MLRGRRWLSQIAAGGPSLADFISGEAAAAAVRPRRPIERKPSWLKASSLSAEATANYERLRDTVRDLNLATVCQEAKCPNIGECWGGAKGTATATIMLMGDTCTRGCRFCAVKTSKAPAAVDPNEPAKVAQAVHKWGLDYVVLTSVDRDDMPDQGAAHIASCVRALKDPTAPPLLVEVLTPDFSGRAELIEQVATSGLDVFAHNIETVESCSPFVRDHRANYRQSLSVLRQAKNAVPKLITKSSIMLGVGETLDEVRKSMQDLLDEGVDVLTLGQYLRPSRRHMKVAEYISPEVFDQLRIEAEALGFAYVASGPLVRSSYRAGEFFLTKILKQRSETMTKL